jgi:hypothetical protein
MVVPRGQAGITLLLSTGEKIDFSHGDIEDIQASSTSSMPTGLLNTLSLQQVADLFAYLEQDRQSEVAQKPPSNKR